MSPMSRRFALITTLVLIACVSWCGPAWAHQAIEAAARTSTPAVAVPTATWSSAPMLPAVPWPAILAAAVALIVAWRRPRRALALAIVLVLALFAFENGVHSVHHLNDLRHLEDLRSGMTCHVAAATAHLSGTPVDATMPEDLVLPSYERLVVQHQPAVDALSLSAHQGRAPPISA
jgi:hypothetical protein